MALKKRDKRMLLILLLLAAAAIGTLTFGKSFLFGGRPQEKVPQVKVPTIGTELLTDPRFKALTSPRGVPVEPGKTGNPNPFPAPIARSATSSR